MCVCFSTAITGLDTFLQTPICIRCVLQRPFLPNVRNQNSPRNQTNARCVGTGHENTDERHSYHVINVLSEKEKKYLQKYRRWMNCRNTKENKTSVTRSFRNFSRNNKRPRLEYLCFCCYFIHSNGSVKTHLLLDRRLRSPTVIHT